MVDTDALSNDDFVVTESDDGLVLEATINRPDQRNALNEAVMRGLVDVLEVADDGPARVVVIRGRGDAFCAGGDMTEFPLGQGTQAYRESFGALSGIFTRMHETDALTVAAVDGHCLAGGLGLAAACEFVFASETATFGTPEVDIGLFPAQAMAPIMRTVTEKRGLKLLFTGEKIDASAAYEMGLITDVVASENFEDELDALVDTLAANSPTLIAMGKEAYYAQRDMDFDAALSYLKEMIALIAMSDETEEGIDAFLMNREPEWRGREP